MFTGLIEDVGTLVARHSLGHAGKLRVATALPLADVKLGDSIAVNGVCLTVEELIPSAKELVFHTLSETLVRTNLGQIPTGGAVNLERALRLGDRLGGHLVSGHVDGTAAITGITRSADDWVFTIQLPPSLAAGLIMKGSIAIDGISLTVASLTSTSFSVHLIPHTLAKTNLEGATAGRIVNLETDMIGKYILRQAELGQVSTGGNKPVTMENFLQAGF